MRYRNFIFDVDGTIWDVADLLTKGWNIAIEKEFGLRDSLDFAWMRKQFGKPTNVILASAFPEFSQQDITRMATVTNAMEKTTTEQASKDAFYPGVLDTLKALSEVARVYLVSNCSAGYIELMMKKGELEPFVLDYESFGRTGKSKAENIRLLMERNALLDDETVYIGDTQMDYEATIAAKVPFIFAQYGLGDCDGGISRIARMNEVLQFVKV